MLQPPRLIHAALALLLFFPVANIAQTPPSPDQDAVELEHFPLTMENVTHFYESMHDLELLSKAHPEAVKGSTIDTEKHESVTVIASRLAAHPPPSFPPSPAATSRHASSPSRNSLTSAPPSPRPCRESWASTAPNWLPTCT